MFPKTKKTKLASFPSDRILSVLLYIETFPQTVIWQKHAVVLGARATTAQSYPGRDTFEFDKGHVIKNETNHSARI